MSNTLATIGSTAYSIGSQLLNFSPLTSGVLNLVVRNLPFEKFPCKDAIKKIAPWALLAFAARSADVVSGNFIIKPIVYAAFAILPVVQIAANYFAGDNDNSVNNSIWWLNTRVVRYIPTALNAGVLILFRATLSAHPVLFGVQVTVTVVDFLLVTRLAKIALDYAKAWLNPTTTIYL